MTQTQREPSTALAVIDPQRVPLATQVFGEERLMLLAEQIGRGWKTPPTPAELEVIAVICQRTRLDPLAKPPQIHFIQRWDSKLGKGVMTPTVGVDGLRTIASRSREYVGPGGQQWCGDDGVWKDVWLSDQPPRAARVGVLKRGVREPLWSVALWDEWAQYQDEYRDGKKTGAKVLAPFWGQKPAHMLAKTAEVMSLKRAFPAETNELEIAHLEELHRLEAPALAARHAEIYGADEDHAFAELPAYVPIRERTDLVDLPRNETTAAPPPPSMPPLSPEKKRRGEYLEIYSSLLTQARQRELIPDAKMADWVVPRDATEADIIERGRQLRALVNRDTVARSTTPAATLPKPEMVDVRSLEYGRMSDLMEAAARLDVPFDEFRTAWPAPKEEVIRKIERLEARVDDARSELEELHANETQGAETALPF